jgi:hypothetical protein
MGTLEPRFGRGGNRGFDFSLRWAPLGDLNPYLALDAHPFTNQKGCSIEDLNQVAPRKFSRGWR